MLNASAQLQLAMAKFLRLPQDIVEPQKLDIFLKEFDLTEKQTAQLRELVKVKEFVKFGQGMQNIRYKRAMRGMQLARLYLDQKKLDDLYYNEWDYQFGNRGYMHVPEEFANYLISHPEFEVLQEAPEFVFDLLKIEKAENILLNTIYRERPGPKPSSLLQTHAFELIKTEYQVTEFVLGIWESRQKTGKCQRPEVLPSKGTQYILMTRDEDLAAGKRMFEIDRETHDFILQEKQEPELKESLPRHYDGLVGINLCKSLK